MKLTDFTKDFCMETVFRLCDCYPDSPVYDAVLKEYEKIAPMALEKLKPEAVYVLDQKEERLYCLETVGAAVSTFSSELFEEGNYLQGMLVNAIADAMLFRMDEKLQEHLQNICWEKGYGVAERLEANETQTLEMQKIAWKKTNAKQEIGVSILESYMFDPIKTNCQVYVLSKECTEYHMKHDCKNCPNLHCKLRKPSTVEMIVIQGTEERKISAVAGQTILEALQEAGIYLHADCGGKGTCGKCKIRCLDGPKQGWHLACKTILESDCKIALGNEEEHFAVVTEHEEGNAGEYADVEKSEEALGIVVDIGTTTIVMQLIDKQRNVKDTFTTINRQRLYGADVISRIQAANDGKLERLQTSILEDLKSGLCSFRGEWLQQVERMVISGNTTMIHLLMGYSCENLGVYPFHPVHTEEICVAGTELFGDARYDFPVQILPGFSAFVGGDIMAGLLTCGFQESKKICALIDLGTNGEMALGCRDKILVASTAAGPAFEGGNITCGTGSIPGAICHVSFQDGTYQMETIADEKPVGICGTGVIDLTYTCLEQGWMDATGLFCDEFLEEGLCVANNPEGKVAFYQKDLREIQLAKAAIRAGFETLVKEYGISYEEIETIYVAGGFGYQIDIAKAVGIGLFPKACERKIKPVGNAALKGNIACLFYKEIQQEWKNLAKQTQEVALALHPDFQESYLKYLYF